MSVEAYVYLFTVEKAIQHTSTEQKPTKYFGCTDDSQWHN